MVESERDSIRNWSSQGSRVPSPKEREQAHALSQPAQCQQGHMPTGYSMTSGQGTWQKV
jgi:hypothetical protein